MQHHNTARLRQLMAEHKLSCPDVAKLLGRAHQTVLIWCSVNPQNIPDSMLELLELKLAMRARLPEQLNLPGVQADA